MFIFTSSGRGKWGIFFLVAAVLGAFVLTSDGNPAGGLGMAVVYIIIAGLLFARDFKYSRTSTADLWARWDGLRDSEPQKIRVGRALVGKLTPKRIDKSARVAIYIGETGKKYRTTLVSCTCPDFKERRVPCKHVYKLASELGECVLPEPVYEKSDHISASVTVTSYYEDVKQKTAGALPRLELGGYRSPSGGYMNVARYKVVGVNPSTGRKNTKIYDAKDEHSATVLAERDALTGPFSVSVEHFQMPSDRQLEYALDLGATLPDDACSDDVSAIISRITDDDEASPSEELGLIADEAGIAFSLYIGAAALYEILRGKKLVK